MTVVGMSTGSPESVTQSIETYVVTDLRLRAHTALAHHGAAMVQQGKEAWLKASLDKTPGARLATCSPMKTWREFLQANSPLRNTHSGRLMRFRGGSSAESRSLDCLAWHARLNPEAMCFPCSRLV